MALSKREAIFVLEYVKRPNATRAAIEAGYSAKSAGQIGYQLLQKPSISEAIAREEHQRLARLGIDADAIIEEVAAIAFSKLDDFADWGPGRFELKESSEIDARAVQSITQKEITLSNEHGETTKIEQGIKTHDKLAALKMLGSRIGVFADRKEISGPGGDAVQVEVKARDYRQALGAFLPADEGES